MLSRTLLKTNGSISGPYLSIREIEFDRNGDELVETTEEVFYVMLGLFVVERCGDEATATRRAEELNEAYRNAALPPLLERFKFVLRSVVAHHGHWLIVSTTYEIQEGGRIIETKEVAALLENGQYLRFGSLEAAMSHIQAAHTPAPVETPTETALPQDTVRRGLRRQGRSGGG